MFAEKLLIIDDNKAICLAMQEELLKDEYGTVDYVLSGEDALEKIKSVKYDIIFLDIVLPGMNGIETCIHIKEHSPDTKIIFMSGCVGVEPIRNDLKRALKGEKVIFLYKPFQENEMSEIINELLKERRFVYTVF